MMKIELLKARAKKLSMEILVSFPRGAGQAPPKQLNPDETSGQAPRNAII